MALQEINRSRQRRTTSDAAVDGLLAGIGAAIIMALFLLAAGFLSGDSPAIVLGRFDPLEGGSPLTGLLTHLAVAAIYGLVFGLIFLALVQLRPSLMKFGWLAGLVYGLLLYGIARGAFFAGANSGLAQFSTISLLLAHLIYGLLTGILVYRKWR
jgi:drug/metabolite transporter (DMT)-like permease